jgi:hypothetical protein
MAGCLRGNVFLQPVWFCRFVIVDEGDEIGAGIDRQSNAGISGNRYSKPWLVVVNHVPKPFFQSENL